jgi:hypothetical protein
VILYSPIAGSIIEEGNQRLKRWIAASGPDRNRWERMVPDETSCGSIFFPRNLPKSLEHFRTIAAELRWLKVIRSVSMGPSAIHESGHFYFAQTGHSHFAPTFVSAFVDLPFGKI